MENRDNSLLLSNFYSDFIFTRNASYFIWMNSKTILHILQFLNVVKIKPMQNDTFESRLAVTLCYIGCRCFEITSIHLHAYMKAHLNHCQLVFFLFFVLFPIRSGWSRLYEISTLYHFHSLVSFCTCLHCFQSRSQTEFYFLHWTFAINRKRLIFSRT